MRREAKIDKREFQDTLKDIERNLDHKKLFAKFTAQRKQLTEQRQDYRATYEGQKLPDPKEAIQAYMDSEETRALYTQLEQFSTSKKVLTPKQMSKLSRQYLKRLFCKMGIRLQVFGRPLTKQKFFDALTAGAAAYPYLRPDQSRGLDPANINRQLTEDMPIYVRRDPTQPDPGIPDDREFDKEEFDLLQGIAIPIPYHKTGHKYTIWLWFSCWRLCTSQCMSQ